MLVELSVVEQRYQAVLAVIRDGVPVVEAASRFGVSRQASEARHRPTSQRVNRSSERRRHPRAQADNDAWLARKAKMAEQGVKRAKPIETDELVQEISLRRATLGAGRRSRGGTRTRAGRYRDRGPARRQRLAL